MNFQRNLAMFSAFKLCTLLLCLVFMHTIEADDVHELRKKQKLALQQRENDLLQMQRELQIQLQRVHSEQLKLEQPDSKLQEVIDSEYEYPSYCANCLGDTLEHINKNLLSSEFSRKVDSTTRKSIQTEKEIRQLSDHNRLEAIKQQILLKLNLSEKPNVKSSIPKQFILDTLDRAGASDFKNSMMMMQSDNFDAESLQHLKNESKHDEKDADEDSEIDDFYGKTKEIISFAEKGQRINSHHILSFSTAIDNQTQPNAKLKIRMATLWVRVGHETHSPRRQHHNNVRNGRTLVNTKPSEVDHNQTLTKRRRRRKKNSGRYSYNHNFDNHIINDSYDDDDHIKSDSNEERHKASKEFSNYTSPIKQNVTLWIFHVRGSNRTTLNSDADEVDEAFDERMEYSTSKQLSLNQLGWQKIDITALVQKWYSSNFHNRLEVLVDCSGCIGRNIKIYMPTEEKRLKQHSARETPFLVLHIEPDLIKRTKRRAIDCSQAGKSQCCKQRFYVSFKTLGWDDWIIAPPGYYANYCRGDCDSGVRRTPDTLLTFYSHVFDEVRKYNKLNGNQLCCAPLKFSSMSLIYFGPDGSEIIKRDLPKMVVEECGCP